MTKICDNDKIILVCAVARSGSTTLQLLLNTIPNSNICGENNGALTHLLEFYKQIKFTQQKVQTEFKEFSDEEKKDISKIFEKRIKPAWFNTFDFNEIKTNIRETIISMFKKNENITTWGCKEIRYEGKLELLKEFRELFPQTKVILNIRENIKKQSISGWLRNDKNSINVIKRQTNELIDFYKANKDFCFLNTLERMYIKKNLENLFDFVDSREHFNERQIKSILMNTVES
jgi:hypothetical protein